VGSVVRLTMVGDASQLEKETAKATTSAQKMSDGVGKSSDKMAASWAKVTSAAVFLTNGVSQLGDGIKAVTDLSRDGAIRADKLARAQVEVAQAAQDMTQALADARQAQLDLNQAQRDSVQAGLDVEQAMLDAEQAQVDYNAAVADFGSGSIEARQAQLDLKQANEDLAQAQLDATQAAEDANQSNLDLAQSAIDVRDAQVALSEAQREAIPPTSIQVWAERLQALSPVLFTVIGGVQLLTTVTSLAAIKMGVVKAATTAWTAVQWLLNAALTANPIGLIVAGIALLIGAIVLVATKTTWFGDLWKTIVDGIVNVVTGIPDAIKAAFSTLANIILWPYKTAFNAISDVWNATVGKLQWTVPTWVPLIGGNTVGAPQLPRFHSGGVVPGSPGQEILAVLQAGETVTPAGQSNNVVLEIRSSGRDTDDFLTMMISRAVKVRGGNVQVAFGR